MQMKPFPKLHGLAVLTTHDHRFLSKLKPDNSTIYVFDKGYNDYKAFKLFSEKGTGIKRQCCL
jgi:hypothetical protein